MNKKVLGVFVSLLALAMLAFSLSVVFAVKPEPTTMTLTGTFMVYPDTIPGVPWSSPYARSFLAGESGIRQFKWKDLPQEMFGDIEGLGTYTGNWVVKNAGTPDAEPNTVAIVLIKDAVVAGVGTGDLKIKAMDLTYKIISATGDLAGLKGEGTIEMLTPVLYAYSIEAQIDP
jgi:hypothetical protein